MSESPLWDIAVCSAITTVDVTVTVHEKRESNAPLKKRCLAPKAGQIQAELLT